MHCVDKAKAPGELTNFTRRLGIAKKSRRHTWPCTKDGKGQEVADLRRMSKQSKTARQLGALPRDLDVWTRRDTGSSVTRARDGPGFG